MNEVTTVGLDLAKRVVSLCGEDAHGRRQALRCRDGLESAMEPQLHLALPPSQPLP